MLLNKNTIEVENKPIDEEEQRREAEKGRESIRRFNQINEDIKESYDEYAAKTKHREKNMREFLIKAEAKYIKDEDGGSSRDGESSREKYSESDSDSSDEDVYSTKPKTNSSKIRCEECNDELLQKSYDRHIQSLKSGKNERLYDRNKIIESANESGKKVTNKDIEQKMDEEYSELKGIKFCDSCNIYLDNNTAYKKHVETLKHKNNVKLNNGEVIKIGDKFDCVTCKTSLSQYSVEQKFKTKLHLDNVEGKVNNITKDNVEGKDNKIIEVSTLSKDKTGYCNICNTRYDNKNKHNESEQHNENIQEKKLVDEKWRDKVNELGLDRNMKHNQIIHTVVIMKVLDSWKLWRQS